MKQCCDCGCDIEIDEKIVSLIEEIWKAEIKIGDSSDEVMIEFLSVDDAEQFLDIVAREFGESPGDLYKRIRLWKFDTYVDDWPVDREEWLTAPSCFNFSIIMRFPLSDVPELVHRLKKYNQPKQCTDCKEKKSKSKFYGDLTMDDGLDVFCMECRQEFFRNREIYE